LYLEGNYVSLQQWPDQLGGLIEYLNFPPAAGLVF